MTRHLWGRQAMLPTAAGSFIVAVNAQFLSFSPLKIREHAGLGCVWQSLPRTVGEEGCGPDGSTRWGCFPGQPSHHVQGRESGFHQRLFLGPSIALKDTQIHGPRASCMRLRLHLGRLKVYSLKTMHVLLSNPEGTRETWRCSSDCERRKETQEAEGQGEETRRRGTSAEKESLLSKPF
uniref:Uncharacterized protein n=1 Tax=Sus scrofa TaxID=9823 RepID=A0A8D1QB49_PIG